MLKQFKYTDNSDIFLTSDTHFGHCNIIRYCNRPFNSVEEMDEKLISNWNSVVSKDSTVFHLGDFAFCGSDKMSKILSRLNGHIVLIKGNHDHLQNTILSKFEDVLPQLHIEIGKKHIYLNHYPFLTYAGAYRSNYVIQLFGHEHLGEAYLNKDVSRLKMLLPTQYDVGVDLNNYRPISWAEVKNKLDYQLEHNVNCLHWIGNGQLLKESWIKKLIKSFI